MFKRRNPQKWYAWAKGQIYPRGGFKRAGLYQLHRLRRLPDPPHRIARGVFAGTFVNFPPIFGLQVVAAVLLAWAMRGNILAAIVATLLSNPVTTPLIAVVSLKLGHWMLGTPEGISMNGVFAAFAAAGGDLWHNFMAIFTKDTAHWEGLKLFWHRIYWPYTLGSILPGLATSALLSWLTIPTLTAYQKLRQRRRKTRAARRKPAPPED
ncbi:MAG: DUF2062 domain-containing protein [Cypionkella sp.]